MIEKKYTPMMQQYLEVKANLKDCIVFYRLGDFYEMFFEDAKIASNELDLVLTGRNAGVEERIPMCGIPYHAATGYIQRLTQKGYKVAIVEQMEDASAGKIVRRDVVKIVTPGTIMEEANENQDTSYLASIYDFKYGYAVVFCEMTCGELSAKMVEHSLSALQKTLLSFHVREVVVMEETDKKVIQMIQGLHAITISTENNIVVKKEYFELLNGIDEEEIKTSFALLSNYLDHTQKRHMSHLSVIELIQDDKYLQMDYSTKINLELIEPVRMSSKSQTLYSFMDHTKTRMGSRMLKKWISYPLIDQNKINQRLDAIEYLNYNFIVKDELKEYLSHIADMERLGAKIAYGNVNPRDLLRLIETLQYAPMVVSVFHECNAYQQFKKVDTCRGLASLLDGILSDEPPINYKDGGIFADQYHEILDEYRHIKNSGKQYILDIESKERERTGISSLKVGYNRIFGYYIEVRSGNVNKIKEEFGYERKQTLANAERFITAELKEKEDMILHAEEKAIRLEIELYQKLIESIKVYLPKLHELARVIAEIDALYALSVVASNTGYIRPTFQVGHTIELLDNRHPILDQMMKEKRYVANNLEMSELDQIKIITGPNMGGKSTYMRQIALTVIMAQMGSYVPARICKLPIFDHIFTRIGASDDIMSGHSTFMVEMMEANYALQNASENSLVLFDEIGRGTSTYDGMSLAYAMLEYLHEHVKAKTLFSTHYHELTALEDKYQGITNLTVDVEEDKDEVIFLYKIKEGRADKSYGVNVARLAKLPSVVLDRAAQILEHVQQDEVDLHVEIKESMQKEDTRAKKVLELLEQADIDEMTPKEAMNFLYVLKNQ